MTTSSVVSELRKYRALAWALVVTVCVSVALFLHYLKLDHTRAVTAFSLDAAHTATISGMRIATLIETLETLGHSFLLMGASNSQVINLMRSLEDDETLVFLCSQQHDKTEVLYIGTRGNTAVTDSCTTNSSVSQTLALPSSAGLAMDVRTLTSPADEAHALEFRIHNNTTRELRAVISTTALLDIIVLEHSDLATLSDTICLSLLVDGAYQKITCHIGHTFAATLPAFTHDTVNTASSVNEFNAAGLHWRLVVQPELLTLAGNISAFPFVILSVSIAIGSIVCIFAYQAADKNIMLETRADELRARLEQLDQLKEQNSLLDQFAAMAAHDLQAPLRYIVSQAHLLIYELKELEQPELSEMAETQVEQGERMRALIVDLLTFCRAGQSTLLITNVDTRAVVDDEVRLLKANKEFARTQIEVGPLPSALSCDGVKLAHMLRNLLGNALKFSQVSSAPKVSISASRDTRHGPWTFRITDNGPGVEEEHRERIFQPFTRLDDKAEGTGMGLAIVKIMVELHGGSIWIDPGNTTGSTFCFSVPGTLPEKIQV